MKSSLVTIPPRHRLAAVAALAAAMGTPAQARQAASVSLPEPSSQESSEQVAGANLRLPQPDLSPLRPWESQPASGTELQMASLGDFRLTFQPEQGKMAPSTPQAAPGGDDSQELAKKLQNPIAALISVPFQFNYDTGFGPKDADRYTLNVQPVIPFSISEDWNLITRTIVPIIYQGSLAEGLSTDFGLGDTTQSFFFSPKEPINGWIIGAGPVALWPTGTAPRIRSESLGLGPTLVALKQEHGWTYGALVNHIWSLTDSDDHDQVNSTFLQPFLSYTWPTATTLAVNTESTYNWSLEEWTVPLHLILRQLVKPGGQPMQLEIGGTYYAASPDNGPEWGLRFTVTFVFPK